MSKSMTASKASEVETITRLLEISKLDTLYRDIYLARARDLLKPLLTPSSYHYLKQRLASLPAVERQLRAAVERVDWKRTQELTDYIRTTRASAAGSGELMGLAEEVYERLVDVAIDPFSPGFHVFHDGSTEKLLECRSQATQILSTLERTDPLKKDFYARRRSQFQALSISVKGKRASEGKATAGPAELQQQALAALDAGDLSQLEKVVQKIKQKPASEETKRAGENVQPLEAADLGEDLLFSFSESTLAGAKRLGLEAVRTKSRRQFAHLVPHGWQPSFLKTETRQWSKDQISRLTYPSEMTDKRRDAIEFFLLNPFMTSCGTRYQVCLVVEDLLVEDFPEPEPKEEMPVTPLLSALGLESRRGLSRIEIENAVLTNGPGIVEQELKLDPEAFRLIPIPADLYGHLGEERGWGQKEIWTHFDGYRILEQGKLQALAGGDKRFGGIHDVVSFNTSYTKEALIARFAVVQRKRMMARQ